MARREGELTVIHAVAPGNLIQRELDARSWTQIQLAEVMDRPVKALNEIIKGKKQITAETATELSRAFDTSAELWLTMESRYRLALAERASSQTRLDAIDERRVALEAAPCYKDLEARGWLGPSSGSLTLTERLCRFFGVAALDDLQHAGDAGAFRVSPASTAPASTLLAYIRGVELEATGITTAEYSADRLEDGIAGLLDLTRDPAQVVDVPGQLAQLGVRFVRVPTLSKARIEGVMLRRQPSPIVSVTSRLTGHDSFWFTLLHELAHLVLGHDDHVETADEPLTDESTEAQANQLAAEWLLPSLAYQRFVAGLTRPISRKTVELFAAQVGRHPGIVVGRLQRDGHLPYSHLNGLKAKLTWEP